VFLEEDAGFGLLEIHEKSLYLNPVLRKKHAVILKLSWQKHRVKVVLAGFYGSR
jgi:hypothetical protein